MVEKFFGGNLKESPIACFCLCLSLKRLGGQDLRYRRDFSYALELLKESYKENNMNKGLYNHNIEHAEFFEGK